MPRVMKRFLSSVLFASVVIAIAVACDSGSSVGFAGSSGSAPAACSDFGTCESCTPELGCGWCFRPDGTGFCATGPGECLYSPQNTWTWDPTGCPAAAHPTVGPEAEGGASEASLDAAPSDATPAADSAVNEDARAPDSGASSVDGAGSGVDGSSSGDANADAGASTVDAGAVDAGSDSADGDAG